MNKTTQQDDVENVVGNLYQAICGTHDDKIKTIAMWLESVFQELQMIESTTLLVHKALEGKSYTHPTW